MNLMYDIIGAIGHHELTLKDSSKKDSFEDFIHNEFLPAYNSTFIGQNILFCKTDRGEEKDKYIFLLLFDTIERRNSYYPENGEPSEEVKQQWNSEEIIRVTNRLNEFVERKFLADYTVINHEPEFHETY